MLTIHVLLLYTSVCRNYRPPKALLDKENLAMPLHDLSTKLMTDLRKEKTVKGTEAEDQADALHELAKAVGLIAGGDLSAWDL